MRRFIMQAAALAILATLATRSWAGAEKQKLSEKAKKAQDAVKAHVDKLEGGQGAQYLVKIEPPVATTFPDHHFVIVRFRVFPVARLMPQGLQASNVFAVDKDGKFTHLKKVKDLEKFFKAKQAAVKEDKEAKAALASWLALSQEYHQDGMFKFEVLQKEFGGDEKTARGRAIVAQGGNGELAVTLTFADGKLAKVTESAKINPGPRPICQATLLLDANPLVRRIAEQDLLIMGLAAGDYLMEQRAAAGPELRDAIDRLWRRILDNGR